MKWQKCYKWEKDESKFRPDITVQYGTKMNRFRLPHRKYTAQVYFPLLTHKDNSETNWNPKHICYKSCRITAMPLVINESKVQCEKLEPYFCFVVLEMNLNRKSLNGRTCIIHAQSSLQTFLVVTFVHWSKYQPQLS